MLEIRTRDRWMVGNSSCFVFRRPGLQQRLLCLRRVACALAVGPHIEGRCRCWEGRIGWKPSGTKPLIQCDQMNRLCFQYLAIYSNESMPISIQIVTKRVKYFAKTNLSLNILPKTFKIWPKWRIFAKSGHTALIPPMKKPLIAAIFTHFYYFGLCNSSRILGEQIILLIGYANCHLVYTGALHITKLREQVL